MNSVQKEPSMKAVQVDQSSYEMPPRVGFSIAHFLTVTDIDRSARYYEKVFGARILSARRQQKVRPHTFRLRILGFL